MRNLIPALSVLLIFVACNKQDFSGEIDSLSQTVAQDALGPLPCHSIAFKSNYLVQPGKVPPFFFTKTLYADTRVKSIHMLSRYSPNFNHSMYLNGAYELKGNFTYSTNAARFTGTRELWEYYKTSSGGAGKRSVRKENIVYDFTFSTAGVCTSVKRGTWEVLKLTYANPGLPNTLSQLRYSDDPDISWDYKVTIDSRGNPTRIYTDGNSYVPSVSYKYDYSRTGDRYNYQPSQYGVCFEYSLLEVMQWVPAGKNPRAGVSVSFIAVDANESLYRATQSQVYQNMKYDSKKNLVSYTYSDNVLQSTTWYCK